MPENYASRSLDAALPETLVATTMPELLAYDASDLESLAKSPGRFTVTWHNPPDAKSSPRNWSSRTKAANMTLISIQSLLNSLASSMLAVAAPAIAADYGLTDTYTPTLPVAFYVLGLGLGPLYLAPLSEIYGRRIIYNVAFPMFTLLNIGCALAPNISTLSILRLLSGMAASAAPALTSASIGDMFSPQERGTAQAYYGFPISLGPIFGGVLGGFIVSYTGNWRWCMWLMVIAPGFFSAISLLVLRESCDIVLLHKKARALAQNTRLPWHTEIRIDGRKSGMKAMIRPFKLLFFSPICTIMSVYMAIVYGILYLHLITIPLLFGPVSYFGLFSYRWSASITGLAYLGMGVGIITGAIVCARPMNSSYAWMQKRHSRKIVTPNSSTSDLLKAVEAPEFRLPFMQVCVFIVPAGLIIFAWTAQKQTHWVGPLLGAMTFGFGMIVLYICIQTYLVDTFEQYAGSALAATVVARSVVAFLLTLVGMQLYVKLDYGWGTTLLALVCTAMIPIPTLLYIYGPRLRERGSNLRL